MSNNTNTTYPSTTDPQDQIDGAIGISLYTLVWIFATGLFIRSLWLQRKNLLDFTVPKFFHISLQFFIAFRIWWLLVRIINTPTTQEQNVEYITGRLALLFFFTAFSLVVFHWADQFRQTLHDAQKLSPMTRVVYFFLVVLVWIAQLVVGGLYLAQTESSEGSLLYEVNTVGVAIINFILSVAFFFYGFRWFLLARSSPDEYAEKKTHLVKISILTSVFVICFFIRVFMWLYNFAGRGALVPEVAWLPLSYYIPELPPTIIQLYIIEEGNFKRQESNYIESLYTVSDDDSDDRKRLSAHWDATLFNAFRNGSSRGSSRDSRGSVGSRPTSRSGSLVVGEGGSNHFLGESSNHFSL